VTPSDHIAITWNGHCACAVSRDLSPGAKMIHIFVIPDPNFPHFVAFRELRRRLRHCVGYKVYCACAVSRDLCIGGPPKPHVTIFWPRIVYSLYNFYGATMSIKGTFILEHLHVKAIFGRKKVQSKSVPKMAVFRKFKGLNIKYGYRDPKRHFLTRNDVFWRRPILRKNPFRGVGCSLIEEPKKRTYYRGLYIYIVTPKARQNHVFGEQKPLNRSLQNFACRVPSRT